MSVPAFPILDQRWSLLCAGLGPAQYFLIVLPAPYPLFRLPDENRFQDPQAG